MPTYNKPVPHIYTLPDYDGRVARILKKGSSLVVDEPLCIYSKYQKDCPQFVEHEYKNVSIIFDQLESLYRIVSKQLDESIAVHKSFQPLLELLYNGIYNFPKCELLDKKFKPISHISDEKEIVVAFSGGRDSLATLLYYMDRGFTVHPVYVRGANRTLETHEYIAVKKQCEMMGIKLNEAQIKINGFHIYNEHPMKNIIIANTIIHWCLENNVAPNIAFGGYEWVSIRDNSFEICVGDTREMWAAYENIIQSIIPNFRIRRPLPKFEEAWNILLSHQDLLFEVDSCVLQIANSINFCGRCWKCARNYIMLADYDLSDYTEGEYMHCLDRLGAAMDAVVGYKTRNAKLLWELFFFYPIEKSKCYHLIERNGFAVTRINHLVTKKPAW